MRRPALVLAVWTLFVWATRIRNALGDGELGGKSKALALSVAGAFTLGAIAVIVALVRRAPLSAVVATLCAATAVYWPVRIVQISTRGHSAAFVTVHAVLGLVSIALAAWAWPYQARTRRAGLLPFR
jgi:hypothetical protein